MKRVVYLFMNVNKGLEVALAVIALPLISVSHFQKGIPPKAVGGLASVREFLTHQTVQCGPVTDGLRGQTINVTNSS